MPTPMRSFSFRGAATRRCGLRKKARSFSFRAGWRGKRLLLPVRTQARRDARSRALLDEAIAAAATARDLAAAAQALDQVGRWTS